MGSIPFDLVAALKQALGLARAIETGTFEGDGTRELSRLFPSVVTIELSDSNIALAKRRLRAHDNIEIVKGNSGHAMGPLLRPETPTLYFLDGHWSAGPGDPPDNQCPLMDELAAIQGGHADDCVIIDDARFFLAAPPPPYTPAQWPRLAEVFDALRVGHPSRHVTLLDDQIIAVPAAAASVVDTFGRPIAYRGEQPNLGVLRRKLVGDRMGPVSPTRRILRHLRRLARDGARRWKSHSGDTAPQLRQPSRRKTTVC